MQGSRTRRQPDRKAPASAGDTALLARVAKRDRGAFRSLYDRYYRPVYRFLYRFSRRPELIEEAVNDVMLVVWENAASFGHRSKVSTWIMGIAYRKGLKLTEKERRHDDRFVNIESHVVAEFPDGSREPADQAMAQDWLESGLRRLSGEHRAVVELTYFCGFSYQEIASIVDCPVNTVKTRMFHARARLKSLLPELGGVQMGY